jgi:uncharacterized membrane protein (DUF373 family)
VVRLTVGGVAGILFLLALAVLFVASVRRIFVKYRDEKKVDIVAAVSLVLVFLILTCICLLLLGPTIGKLFDLTSLPD